MIGYLRGAVLQLGPERVLLDVQGVGYEVGIPLSTFYEIERATAAAAVTGTAASGVAVALYIHTHLREDGIALFGFSSEREKQLFEKLISISGIGPRLARAVLSGLSADDLLAALAAGDLGRLASVPGIGKKTAERMVLELRDKAREMAASLGAPGATVPGDHDVVSALVNLGYKPALAERAVSAARRERPDAPFQDLLRASLSQLARL